MGKGECYREWGKFLVISGGRRWFEDVLTGVLSGLLLTKGL